MTNDFSAVACPKLTIPHSNVTDHLGFVPDRTTVSCDFGYAVPNTDGSIVFSNKIFTVTCQANRNWDWNGAPLCSGKNQTVRLILIMGK